MWSIGREALGVGIKGEISPQKALPCTGFWPAREVSHKRGRETPVRRFDAREEQAAWPQNGPFSGTRTLNMRRYFVIDSLELGIVSQLWGHAFPNR